MDAMHDFELPKWIEGEMHRASLVAGGSTGPSMSINDLKAISTDPDKTAAALNLDAMQLSAYTVDDRGVAERVAALYDQNKINITADDVLVANATTGANGLVFQALLSPGDHVVATLPGYEPLVEVPRALGAEVSILKLEERKEWQLDVGELKALIKPSTKMIILNNPHNPTGAILSDATQAEIVKLAAERDIIVFCDEIFRPLFHTDEKPPSMLEQSGYDRIIVTGSLSKAWGFAGVRIGWVVTKNKTFHEKLFRMKEWMLQGVSVVDKVIAQEVLSERCKANIMKKNIGYAAENLKTLSVLMDAHKDKMACCLPPGGGTAFVKFLQPRVNNGSHGVPVDDVAFCERLLDEEKLLLTPASRGYGPDVEGSIKGYARLHITVPPEMFKKVVGILDRFLKSDSFADLCAAG